MSARYGVFGVTASLVAAAAAAAALLLTLTTRRAKAQEQPLQVHSRGCQQLNAVKLMRLTRLELAGMAHEHIEVWYRCTATTIAIDLRETRRDMVVTREMPRDCCQVSAERTLALLAAGLYTVAAPLLHPTPSSDREDVAIPPAGNTRNSTDNGNSVDNGEAPSVNAPPPAPMPLPNVPRNPWMRPLPSPARTAAAPPARWIAPPRLTAAEPADTLPLPAGAVHGVGAAAHVRVYNVGNAITSYGLRLNYLYWVDEQLGVGPMVEADFSTLERMGGSVDARVFHLGGRLAWRPLRSRLVDAAVVPFAALSVVQLEGEPSSDGWQAGTLSGVTGASGLQLATWLGPGPLRLVAAAEAGVLFRAPRGEVSEQTTIQLDGLWLGFGLGVDVGWGGGRGTPARSATAMKGMR